MRWFKSIFFILLCMFTICSFSTQQSVGTIQNDIAILKQINVNLAQPDPILTQVENDYETLNNLIAKLNKTLNTLNKEKNALDQLINKDSVGLVLKNQESTIDLKDYLLTIKEKRENLQNEIAEIQVTLNLADNLFDTTMKLDKKLHRLQTRQVTNNLYTKATWVKGYDEVKSLILSPQIINKLLLFSMSLFAIAIAFIIYQWMLLFCFRRLQWLYIVATKTPIVKFTIDYFSRVFLFAVLLEIARQAFSDIILVNSLLRACQFLLLTSGLFFFMNNTYSLGTTEERCQHRWNFNIVMLLMAILIFINNLNIFTIDLDFTPKNTSEMVTIVSFVVLLFNIFLIFKLLPKEFRARLFSNGIQCMATYFLLRTFFLLFSLTAPIIIFFGREGMVLNNLLNLFQLTVVIVVLTYTHRLIVNFLPFFIAAFFHFFAEPNEVGKKHLLFTYWMSSLLAAVFLILGLVAAVRIIEIPYPILQKTYNILFVQGLPLGKNFYFPVSNILWALFAYFLLFYLTRLIQLIAEKKILAYTNLDFGTKQAIKTTIGYLGLTIALSVAIVSLGFDMKTLTFILSGLSVGIGIGMQGLFLNFFSGFVLLFERPIKEGDYLELNGRYGRVNKIRLRSTEIISKNHETIIVPNSQFVLSSITNSSKEPEGRVQVNVYVPYSTDGKLVEEILLNIAASYPEVHEKASVRCKGDCGYGVHYQLRAYVKWQNYGWISSELYKAILSKLAELGLIANSKERDVIVSMSEESHPIKVVTTKN